MLKINWKYVYEVIFNDCVEWRIILYNISSNHYVGIRISDKIGRNSIYLDSINKYVFLDDLKDIKFINIRKCIYLKGKPLIINDLEYNKILKKVKNALLEYISKNTKNNYDGIAYTKWCKEKISIINKKEKVQNLKVGAICWVDFGYNIGNELRKIRPAIL